MIPKPIPNRHMPAISTAGADTQIRLVIPAVAISSPGISSLA